MRLIDADRLYPDRMTNKGTVAISQSQIAKAPTINAIPISAIEDIKQEIKEEKEFAYADFERYKVECLGMDWEDAYDSLPQDDYRYGMERCIEIINKYREVSE